MRPRVYPLSPPLLPSVCIQSAPACSLRYQMINHLEGKVLYFRKCTHLSLRYGEAVCSPKALESMAIFCMYIC